MPSINSLGLAVRVASVPTFHPGGKSMNCKVSEGQRYICSNPLRRCEMEVRAAPGADAVTRPQCVCGSAMKKPYVKPAFTKLTPEDAKELFAKWAFD